jgi:hypothetical protein
MGLIELKEKKEKTSSLHVAATTKLFYKNHMTQARSPGLGMRIGECSS